MITGGDLRQSRLDVGYKTFTISPWGEYDAEQRKECHAWHISRDQKETSAPISRRILLQIQPKI